MNTATTVKERPILFSGPMVRALLDGRKTQTRRVVKGPIEFIGGKGDRHNDPTCYGWANKYGDYHTLAPEGQSSCDETCVIPCPYGRVGDRLWVRETWRYYFFGCHGVNSRGIQWAADGYCRWNTNAKPITDDRWRPSIHMPRRASRITLEIAGVKAERLQDITEEDARAEGVDPQPHPKFPKLMAGGHVRAFRSLWDSINGKSYPWASSPWVWAITFKVLEIKGGQS